MESYIRNDIQFFHNHRVKRSIADIASCSGLIVYCGAGVTIDRTGLNWGGLIERVFLESEGSEPADPTVHEIRTLLGREDPRRVATILAEYRLRHSDGNDDLIEYLTPRIQQNLYKQNGWQEGRLSRQIVELAVSFVEQGKPATIVTSNYDTYTEQAYKEHSEYRAEAGASPWPEMCSLVLGEAPLDDILRWDADAIRLVYLHGKVPQEGGSVGHLVINEVDYVETRESVLEVLEHLIRRPGAATLILGSSLTDPPLIEALIKTRASEHHGRYAVVPMSSTGHTDRPQDEASRLAQHAMARCKLLGTELLVPDFMYQIAQFCRELTLVEDSPRSANALLWGNKSYGKRLQKWWQEWNDSPVRRNPRSVNRCLTQLHNRFLTTVNQTPHFRDPEEFRFEVWVRSNPGDASRRLALWASSEWIAPDKDSFMRFEELSLATRHASVKTFLEGRPQYFASDHHDSRWRAFFSVPIFVDQDGNEIPVGVVSLASTNEPGDSAITPGYPKVMDGLVKNMQLLGWKLLSTDQSVRKGNKTRRARTALPELEQELSEAFYDTWREYANPA